MEGGEGIPQTSPLIWRLPQHSPDSTPKLTFTDPKTHRRLPQHSRDSTPKLTFRGNFSWFSAGLRHPESRSEEHTSELQSLMRISYTVFCFKKKKKQQYISQTLQHTNTITLHIIKQHK